MLVAAGSMARTWALACAFCLIELPSVPTVAAQQPKEAAPAAPVSAQIMTAKRIFIANAPGENPPKSLGTPDRTYSEFYAAMKSSGDYVLVPTPAEADLVFEISFSSLLSGVGGTSATGCSSSTEYTVRLTIVDPKTRLPLWWFSEPVRLQGGFSHRKDTLDRVYLQAISTLVEDVKKLATRR